MCYIRNKMYLAALVIFGSTLNFSGVSTLTINIEPKQAHVKPRVPFTIMCKADAPLSGCQFAWKNSLSQGPIIDFSLSSASPARSLNDINSGEVKEYSYFGSGLENGDCGINVTIARFGSRIFGCRVRKSTGGWVYADLGVQVDAKESIPLNIIPTDAVVNLADNVNFLCLANEPLRECTIHLPNGNLARYKQGSHFVVDENVHYFGTGLENGQCGFRIFNISEKLNGRVLCAVKTLNSKAYEVGSMALILAEAPTDLSLTVKENPIPSGRPLEATCSVGECRPDPTIIWYLGADIIRESSDDDSNPRNEWAWKNLTRSISQTITRNVTSRDNGKELRCEVSHPGLPNRMVDTVVLSVEAPPSCPPVTLPSLNVICVMGGKVGCAEPIMPGTIAYLYCKPGYVLGQPAPDYSNMTCQENGKWNKRGFECVLDCGRRMLKDGATLISNGQDAQVGEFPWHVAIYQKVGQSYAHICGGTLIREDMVVSAAHCFWNNQNTTKNSPSIYKVVAGKHYREWSADAREAKPPQQRDLEEIMIPDRYTGRESNFVQDIALLRLKISVEISEYVNVICIDWENLREQDALEPLNNGTVPGWGFTETGVQSDELKVVDLPFIDFHSCRRELPPVSRPILTPDKFCAGYVNRNISVCGGDSGGGMVFLDAKHERYFIRGIVSVAFKPFENTDKCFAQLYTAFTRFSTFIPWIKRYY